MRIIWAEFSLDPLLRIYEELHLRDDRGWRNRLSSHARGFRVHRLGLLASGISVRYRAPDARKSFPYRSEHGQRIAAFAAARASGASRDILD
jgi:hypothetical protein